MATGNAMFLASMRAAELVHADDLTRLVRIGAMLMIEQSHPVFRIGGILTLPLCILRTTTLENLSSHASGDHSVEDFVPRYHIPRISNSTVKSFDTDAQFALAMVGCWRTHCSDFCYFVQFLEDDLEARSKVLRLHTRLIAEQCELRLNIDPTPIDRALNACFTFQFVHASYRNDPHRDQNRPTYLASLAQSANDLDHHMHDAKSLLARVAAEIAIREATWANLPSPLHSTRIKALKDIAEAPTADAVTVDLGELLPRQVKPQPSQPKPARFFDA
jgi:hypothetical protein